VVILSKIKPIYILKQLFFKPRRSGGIKAFIRDPTEDSTDKIERESSFNSSGLQKQRKMRFRILRLKVSNAGSNEY
jgi:3-deoxy-D-arabino-heptulosonate 7-phosphate (DAHP) synthase